MSATEVWTIQAALDWTVGYLERKGDPSPRLSAQWLLSEATQRSRIELYAHFDQPLSLPEREVLRDYVTRRGKGEPLQYITGEVAFRYLTLKVSPGVLIPRPETEVLVSEALLLLPTPVRPRAKDSENAAVDQLIDPDSTLQDTEEDLEQSVTFQGEEGCVSSHGESTEPPSLLVADICTGSGCIACSIAHEHPQARIIATDLSTEAVQLAEKNIDYLNLADRIDLLQCDLGEAIAQDLLGSFDVVVSNPPYIPTAVLHEIPREVSDFEPALALDGGDDGLDIYRRLLTWSYRALKLGGGCAFELHETCMDEAARLAQGAGFNDIRIVNDLANRPRILVAKKNNDSISFR